MLLSKHSIDNRTIYPVIFNKMTVKIFMFLLTVILVQGNFSSIYSQSVDDGFFDLELDGSVYALSINFDGAILIGGNFSTINGVQRHFIARLHSNGGLDLSFNPGANNRVQSLLVQDDGKILVGGLFSRIGGQERSCIARLNPDGSLDASFNPALFDEGFQPSVRALVAQQDGKILVGGTFTSLGGLNRNNIARLNINGSVDDTFNPEINGSVVSMAIQADGKILVGGSFTIINGQLRNHLARLNPDGSVDEFNAPEINNDILSLAIQADGMILVGGGFTRIGEFDRHYIARLLPNGTVDTDFNPQGGNSVLSLAIQADGLILVGGGFETMGGEVRPYIAQLFPSGNLDTEFMLEVDKTIFALAVEADGKILVGGDFTKIGAETRKFITRLTNPKPCFQTLGVAKSGRVIVWNRSGGVPELGHVLFDLSKDGGLTYFPLGTASRTTTGWELTGVNLPLNESFIIRARGYYTTGMFNGSGSVVELVEEVMLQKNMAIPEVYILLLDDEI